MLRKAQGLIAAVLVGVAFAIAQSAAGASAVPNNAPGSPTHLTVDDAAAPRSVAGAPAFGWRVVDRDPGETQTSYQLLVADRPTSEPHNRHVLFAGARVHSSQQAYVVPIGLRVRPDRRYWWTVRTWDRHGQAGAFARPAPFDTALGDADWHASWIRRAGAPATPNEDFTLARIEKRLGRSPIVRARADVSAGQQFELYINGARVAHGPSFAYPDEQYYEVVDIARALHAGRANAIGVVTHWTTAGQGRPASVPGLIAHISVEHADGSREVITTGRAWRVHSGPWTAGPPRNEEGDFVERVDERLEPDGWDRPGFDDAQWEQPALVGAHPVAPFLHLVPARTHIVEHAVRPRTITMRASGGWVADFGEVVAATPELDVTNGADGRGVQLVAGDLLEPDGSVSRVNGTQGTLMQWEFTERAGAQQLRPFGYLGFRYLEIDGAAQALTRSTVRAWARHASMPDENAATFQSSDARVDAVWQLARHSALYSAQEQFVDTPTREKGQFLADAVNISSATMRAFGERALTAQALRDFARSQARYWPDGRVNAVYPNGDGKRDIPDFTERYVEWVWRAYLDTGDRRLLTDLYPVCKRIAAYLASAIPSEPSGTGLVTDLPGGDGDYLHGIVDWPVAMRYGYDVATAARTTENALAVEAFARDGDMARALRRPAGEASRQDRRAGSLRAAMVRRLERTDGVFVDGLGSDGAPSARASQHANAFALAFGIVPRAQRSAVAQYVGGAGTAMGPMTIDTMFQALHAAGRDDAIVAALTDAQRPGFAQILGRGATFTWESWNARDVPGDSESHGWGSTVLATMQADLLGVRISEPGAARIDVRTPATTLTRAAGRVPTQRGPVTVSWERSPKRFSLDLTIPPNMTADAHVPAAHVDDVRDGGRKLRTAGGVTAFRVKGTDVVVTLGSGHHVLTSP